MTHEAERRDGGVVSGWSGGWSSGPYAGSGGQIGGGERMRCFPARSGLWCSLGQASSVAQLVGVDALWLVSTVVQAAPGVLRQWPRHGRREDIEAEDGRWLLSSPATAHSSVLDKNKRGKKRNERDLKKM